MKIVVTGANGLLGQKLLKRLARESVQVHALARGEDRNPKGGSHHYHKIDLTDKQALQSLIQEISPDVVIHGAAMTNVDTCEERPEDCHIQNVEVTKSIVASCESINAFLIHISTDFIFDGKQGDYKETDEPNPLSIYGRSKLEAEKVVENSNINWAIARTILVFGVIWDHSRSNIVLWVKKSLEDGKSIQLINDQWRMPTLAEDLAEGCWLIAQKKAQGIFNISGKDLLNPYQIGVETARFFGLNESLISETDGSKFTQPAKRPPKTGFDLTKSRGILGYEPKSFKEGLEVLKGQL